jgi:hypothetical protein
MNACQTMPTIRIGADAGITTKACQCWASVWLDNGAVCAPHDITRCLSEYSWSLYA